MTKLGDWTTCADSECREWQTCTKAHACLSKEDHTTLPARGFLNRNGRPISKEDLIEEQNAAAMETITVPRPPNGRPAHEMLFEAIIGLSDQFAVCGLEQPVALVVKPGQAKLIQAMVMHSPHMLFDDARCGELRIWSIPIREATP